MVPINIRVKVLNYLGQPIKCSKFDFEVITIANIESRGSIGIFAEIGLNGPNEQ